MAPSKPPALGRGPVSKSRSANDRQQESIYNIGNNIPAQVAPRVRTYNAAPPSPTGAGASAPGPQKARMHGDSSQVSSIINPVHGVRDAQARQGQKPFDHARANALAVKEASQLNALRKQTSNDLQQLQGGPPSQLPRSSSLPMRRASPVPGGQHQAPYAQYGEGGQPSTSGRNFVAENKMGAGAPARVGRPDSQEDDGLKYLNKADYGRVPTYLLHRKIEMAEAAAEVERAKELAMVPPGMRLLPEEERLETLSILARNKVDVERALQGLPIVIETPSAIRRKNELEQRLREIEDATKVFSRAKVLVHL